MSAPEQQVVEEAVAETMAAPVVETLSTMEAMLMMADVAGARGGVEGGETPPAHEELPPDESAFNPRLFVRVRCSDGVEMMLPREHAAQMAFLPAAAEADEDECTFAYSSLTLNHLYAWVRHYGMHGVAASALPRPCTYPDFCYVAVDKWDSSYYTDCVVNYGRSYVATIRAAEEYGMAGLHDFLCVALGCELRGADSQSKILMLLGLGFDEEAISSEELARVDADYPWLAAMTQPVGVQ